MDAGHFDRIAVAIGGTAGRRAALRLLAAGVLTAIAGRHVPAALGYQACDGQCATDEGCCDGACQFLGEDDRCGDCDTVCARGETCQECVTYAPGAPDPFPFCPAGPPDERYRCCPQGMYNTNGVCCDDAGPLQVNCCTVASAAAERCRPECLPLTEIPGRDPVLVHDEHCGRCGNRCGDDKECVAGTCRCKEGLQACGNGICRTCCAHSDCTAGQRCCDGVCRACCEDRDCAGVDHTCQDGVCACPAGTQTCGDGLCAAAGRCCDNTDCPGGSGKLCPSPGGICQCPSGLKDCAGICHECCNNSDCDLGHTCQQSVCRCPSGQHDCEGTCRQCCDDGHCLGAQRCRDGVCACPTAATNCGGGVCAATGHCCTDADCPGGSGQTCPAPGGVCGCPAGKKDCAGRCITSSACCTTADCPRDSGQFCPNPGAACRCPDDHRDCNGVCRLCCADADCSGGQRCQSGICACPLGTLVCGGGICAAPGHCCNDDNCSGGKFCPGPDSICVCPSGHRDCAGVCVADGECCGIADCTGGKVCPGPGEICRCPDDRLECHGVCIDRFSDPGHCGVCDNACPSGGFCSGGGCACPDAIPNDCGDFCTDLKTDIGNCGSCGNVCGDGQSCSDGFCTSPPIDCTPLENCDGMCIDIHGSDNDNCGGCGFFCPQLTSCFQGQCFGIDPPTPFPEPIFE